MDITTDLYSASYSDAANTLTMSGCITSGDPELFKQLDEFLEKVQKNNRLSMVWDLRTLKEMNSAGLGVLYRFVAARRDNPDYALKVKANSCIYWQERLLPNLKKFLPSVQLEFFQV